MNEEDKKSFDSRARHNEIRNLIPETSFGRENRLIIAENSTIHSLTPNLVMYKPSKTNSSAPIQLKRKRSSLQEKNNKNTRNPGSRYERKNMTTLNVTYEEKQLICIMRKNRELKRQILELTGIQKETEQWTEANRVKYFAKFARKRYGAGGGCLGFTAEERQRFEYLDFNRREQNWIFNQSSIRKEYMELTTRIENCRKLQKKVASTDSQRKKRRLVHKNSRS